MDKIEVILEYACRVEGYELKHNARLDNSSDSADHDRYGITKEFETRYIEIPKGSTSPDTHLRIFSKDDQSQASKMPATIDAYLRDSHNASLIGDYNNTQNDRNCHISIYHLVGEDVTVKVELHEEVRKDNKEVYGLSVHLRSGSNVDDVVEGILSVVPELERQK
tara:strand:- start:181 stop:675 length:495 start_codon:yes stop_codon:yes gene_type:complete